MRRFHRFVLLALVFFAAPFTPHVSHAGLLNDNDIVIPGNGSMWKLGSPTPWLSNAPFTSAGDAIEDEQGRIVFLGGRHGNDNDVCLYRVDPATGVFERLLLLPYIASPGDTLPSGLEGARGFASNSQSLHLEKTYTMSINDTVNGGVPQVGSESNYAFSMGASFGGPSLVPVEVRWVPSRGTAEQGLDLSPCGLTFGPAMTTIGGSTWYGGGDLASAGPELDVHAHLQVGGVTVNARLQVTTSNQVVYKGVIIDDTTIPNVSVTCDKTTDTDVPMVNGGFSGLAVGTLGALNGSLYTTSNYGPNGSPYLFNIAPRSAFLNPYNCQYYNSVTVMGGTPWIAGDTLGTWPGRGESADGGSVLGNANGNIISVSPGGGVALLGRNPGNYAGRPIRWHAPSSLHPALAGRATVAATGDTTLGALVLRADTLVRVLVTDPNGRRIGVTASDSIVNEFGSAGMVKALGANGWPLLITILGPANGNHRIDINGAAGGSYGVSAYLAETSTGGVKSPITATIGSGEHQLRFLNVTNPLTLSWLPATAGVGDGPLARASSFDAVGPIPASNVVRFAWHMQQPGGVRLEIFDLAGRRVATLANGDRASGKFTSEWSGRGDDGRRLGAGVYLARLSVNGTTQVRRVVLTR